MGKFCTQGQLHTCDICKLSLLRRPYNNSETSLQRETLEIAILYPCSDSGTLNKGHIGEFRGNIQSTHIVSIQRYVMYLKGSIEVNDITGTSSCTKGDKYIAAQKWIIYQQY